MKSNRTSLIRATAIGAVAILACSHLASTAWAGGPAGTAITYQGILKDTGANVNGSTNFEFRLFNDEFAGSQVGSTVLTTETVTDGLFTATLDFGVNPYVSDGPLWLEVTVEAQTLSRQQVTSAPFSLATRGVNVDAAENVGIGTISPASKLDVVGTINTDGHYALDGNRILDSDDGSNVSVGVGAGLSGSFGNTLIGELSGQSTTGVNNTFVGRRSALANTTGTANAFFGTFTGFNSTGSNNTFIGASAGGPSTTGSNNTALGFSAHVAAGASNATAVGANTIANQSNTVVLGNGANVGIGTTTPTTKLDVSGTVTATAFVGDGSGLTNLPGGGGVWLTSGPDIYFNTGDVGIGTTTPASKLDVRYDGTNGIEVTDTDGLTSSIGVHATVGTGTGVRGESTSTTGVHYGVYGQVPDTNAAAWGVFSNGRLGATGTKSFCIDHPLDPGNAFLMHYSSESPEPQNRYNGNVFLDENGEAVVQLPSYFEAINVSERYNLTPIGAPAPNLYVAQKVVNNQFLIAGGQPGQEVSWEVTAKRSDAFVRQLGAPVEMQKSAAERGHYLTPELYGMPKELRIGFKPAADAE